MYIIQENGQNLPMFLYMYQYILNIKSIPFPNPYQLQYFYIISQAIVKVNFNVSNVETYSGLMLRVKVIGGIKISGATDILLKKYRKGIK